MGILWTYCDACSRRIEVGETCYQMGDTLPDGEYSGLTFCEDCCKAVNTMHEWKIYVDGEDDGSV